MSFNSTDLIESYYSQNVDSRNSVGSHISNVYETKFGEINVSRSSRIHVGTKISKLVIDNYNVDKNSKSKIHESRLTNIGLNWISLIIISIIVLFLILFCGVFVYVINVLLSASEKVYSSSSNNNINGKHKVPFYKEIVYISLNLTCNNSDSCAFIISTSDLSEKYNFFIDNKGVLFNGSGWESEALKFKSDAYFRCLQICFIGDYDIQIPSENLWKSLENLLNEGISKKYLTSDYVTSPSCCYIKDSNPGINVLKHIEKDKHFVTGCRNNQYLCPWSVINNNSNITLKEFFSLSSEIIFNINLSIKNKKLSVSNKTDKNNLKIISGNNSEIFSSPTTSLNDEQLHGVKNEKSINNITFANITPSIISGDKNVKLPFNVKTTLEKFPLHGSYINTTKLSTIDSATNSLEIMNISSINEDKYTLSTFDFVSNLTGTSKRPFINEVFSTLLTVDSVTDVTDTIEMSSINAVYSTMPTVDTDSSVTETTEMPILDNSILYQV